MREYNRDTAEFVDDFELVIENAKKYNSPETIFYKSAEKLHQYGMKEIEKNLVSIDFDLPEELYVHVPILQKVAMDVEMPVLV